jgi:hypothetical protein
LELIDWLQDCSAVAELRSLPQLRAHQQQETKRDAIDPFCQGPSLSFSKHEGSSARGNRLKARDEGKATRMVGASAVVW